MMLRVGIGSLWCVSLFLWFNYTPVAKHNVRTYVHILKVFLKIVFCDTSQLLDLNGYMIYN